jgi:hypothetical protein
VVDQKQGAVCLNQTGVDQKQNTVCLKQNTVDQKHYVMDHNQL